MAYMNYISAINSFWDTAALNPLSTGQVSLYFALLHVNNRSNWTEWFTVPNQVLSVLTGLSRSGILKARNELRQRGLIEFRERGTKASTQDSTRDSTQKGVQNSMQDGVQNSSTLKDININENRKSISNDIPEKMDFSEQYTTIQDLYNSVCGSYPRLVKLSEARKKAIRARLNTGYTVDDFRRLFKTAEQSDFLKGKNNRNWRATFDWLISDANMAKVLDGNYENRKKEAEPDATEGRSATDYYRQYMHHSDGETGGDVPD